MGSPRLTISTGDPAGIGPEVTVRALGAHAGITATVHGSDACLRNAALGAGIAPFWSVVRDCSAVPPPGVVVVDDGAAWQSPEPAADSALGGTRSFAWVERAIEDAKRPPGDPWRADAIVTAPISKRSWALAGHGAFPGHTELLADRFGVPECVMMFHSPASEHAGALNVALVTAHVPLGRVPALVTPERVLRAIELGHEACARLGTPLARVAVCGVNPHAGEGGLLGVDEARGVTPAIEAARSRGLEVSGPFPADTVFVRAVRGEFDLVVAMYHDQGLIPVKLLGFDRAVNMTLGLPVVRTSPDHGTAFDIAGRWKADAGSMRGALDLALRLAPPRAR